MTTDEVSDRLRELTAGFVSRVAAQVPVPGFAVVVVDAEGIVAQSFHGLADVGRWLPVTPSHRFEIGSISKVVTSLLVNQLVDEGLLDLDGAAVDVLPWLDLGISADPTGSTAATGSAVTVRHLLSHTAGLVLGADGLPDELAQVWGIRELTRSGPPGNRFHYSNLGFMVLGTMASTVTGRPFAELVTTHVFEPMGIAGAPTALTHRDREDLAVGYWPWYDDRPWVPGDAVAPATWFEAATADGNVAMTVGELGRFARLLLGDGTLDGRRVVSEQALRRILTPQAPTGEPVAQWGDSPGAQESRYGLGVNLERIDGHLCATHGGGMVGYASFVLADRDAGLGIGVLTNGNGDHPAAQLVARVVHGLYLTARAGSHVQAPPDPTAAVSVSEVGRAMLGDFAQHGDAGVRIGLGVAPDGSLAVRTATGAGRLIRTWSDRFATDHPDLRAHHLVFDARRSTWRYGDAELFPVGPEGTAAGGTPVLDERLAAYVGHYRSYTPWYPHLRVLAVAGRLLLSAPGGVEAPDDDPELVEITPGVFRIGSDPWLPERLVAGPVVQGRAVSMTRDGVVYSRSFTP